MLNQIKSNQNRMQRNGTKVMFGFVGQREFEHLKNYVYAFGCVYDAIIKSHWSGACYDVNAACVLVA